MDFAGLEEWCREIMERQMDAKKKALKGRHEKTELKNGPLSRRKWEDMITYLVEEPVAGDGLRDLAYRYFE